MKSLVTIDGGVSDVVHEGDEAGVIVIDFDDWNDLDTTNDRRQEMIETCTDAGFRCVVFSRENERWNIMIFSPQENYDNWITEHVPSDASFAVYDPYEAHWHNV